MCTLLIFSFPVYTDLRTLIEDVFSFYYTMNPVRNIDSLRLILVPFYNFWIEKFLNKYTRNSITIFLTQIKKFLLAYVVGLHDSFYQIPLPEPLFTFFIEV